MNGFHRVVSLVAGVCVVAATGCLPLPNEVAATFCQTEPSGPPTVEDLAVLGRLEGRGLDVSWSSPPSIHLDAHDGATATALRAEFGSAIDIEIGQKRLKRVDGNPDGCLLRSPTWAIGGPTPSGVSLTVTPTQRSFDRNGTVDATVRITNRTTQAIVVSLPTPVRCGATQSAALSSTTSALAVNLSDGVWPEDPFFFLPRGTRRSYGMLTRAPDGTLSVIQTLSVCMAETPAAVTIGRGRSAELPISASTESMQPTADPLVTPGRYHLRALVDVRLSTDPGAPSRRVAAPPTAIELR